MLMFKLKQRIRNDIEFAETFEDCKRICASYGELFAYEVKRCKQKKKDLAKQYKRKKQYDIRLCPICKRKRLIPNENNKKNKYI